MSCAARSSSWVRASAASRRCCSACSRRRALVGCSLVGSFFQVRHDDAESGYRYFFRISRLVQAVLDMREAEHPLVVGMTCGALEENAANNRDALASALRRDATLTLHEVADLHNYTAWRDSLDPCLTDVLRRVWSTHGCGGDPGGRVGSHGDHLGATAGAGSGRDAPRSCGTAPGDDRCCSSRRRPARPVTPSTTACWMPCTGSSRPAG